jgi:hypothetical protein
LDCRNFVILLPGPATPFVSSSQPTFGTEAPKVQRSVLNLPASVILACVVISDS